MASSGKEIISFQFGHYSNYVGAHWWNIQESGFQYGASDKPSEINHDILFREGQTSRNEVTFTPRLLLVDLKGSLSHLSIHGELYDRPEEPTPSIVQWTEGNVEVKQEPKASKSQFLEDLDKEEVQNHGDDKALAPANYDLDENVHVWADFLRARYHPRTVNVVSEYQHESETKPFDIFNYGTDLWRTDSFQDNFADLIRNYAEECDNMQGFHILLDATDGFAGLGTSCIQHLQDEYLSKSVLAFPTIPSAFPASSAVQDSIRTMNLALCFQSLAEHTSLFVPLCTGSSGWGQPGTPKKFPHIEYNELLPYHSSALLAAALDTVTLRYRVHGDDPSCLSDMTGSLGYLGRKAAAASLGLPFAMHRESYLFDTLEKLEGPLWQSLSPNCRLEDDHMWIQSVTLRGVPHSRLRDNASAARNPYQCNNPVYSCKTRSEMLRLFLAFNCYSTATHVTTADAPFRVTTPFPRLFSDLVGPYGAVDTVPRAGTLGVESVPAIAGLHSCRGVGQMIETLSTEASKIPYRRRHQFQESGLDEDEYKECLNQILNLRECYLEDFE